MSRECKLGSDPRLLVNIFRGGNRSMRRLFQKRMPHHGRGGSQHIGRTRIKLAKIISECLDIDCRPEDLMPAGGRQRNNTTEFDGYAWEMFARTHSGMPVNAGSFDTMTDCVKAGKVKLIKGEISLEWSK